MKFIDGYEKLGKDENEAKECAIKDMANNKKVILKLQRPLITNGSYNEILVYNESGDINELWDFDKKTIKQVFGKEYKVYWLGEIDEKRQGIRLVEQVEEQAW